MSEVKIEASYYTPSIEEFHVGFEYQYMIPEKRWDDQDLVLEWTDDAYGDLNDLIGGYDGETTIDDIRSGYRKTRVKYLDREDIESLGWEYVPFVPQGEQGDRWYHVHEKNGLLMTSGGVSDDKVAIFKDKGNFHRDTKFEGVIKNKSELKKVLAMLNIK